MSKRRATAANPEPDAAPGSPPTEINADSIDPRPNAEEDTGDHLMADQPQNDDVPGPSTTYMAPQDEPEPAATRPRAPSPPMPSLRTRHFPPEDSDDEDDEVVAKLPVYLSPHLFPTLNLFQYPLRTETLVPPKYAQERNKFITTRVKEGVGRIEVEMPVDEDLNYWRRERAEELGFVRDINEDESGVVGGYGFGGRSDRDKEKSKGKKKEKHWGEKMRLKSEPIPNETGYYSGIIQDGALYLHPVSKVAQFRASLGYLDDFDEKVRTRNMRKKEEPEDKKAKAGGISQLGMPNRAKKGEEENDGSGSLKQFREKMWSMAREEEEDPWVTYAWKYGDDEDAVGKAFSKLLVSPDKRDQLACKTRPLDYLDNPRNRDDLFKR